MADNNQQLQDIERLSQDIISKFEKALNVSTTSELSSMVENINKSLDQQTKLIQTISTTSNDRLKTANNESLIIKKTTSEVEKQSKLYQQILGHNDDISDNWSKMIQQSATVGKNYSEITKKQKEYLTNMNVGLKKEKKLAELTAKRLKTLPSGGKQSKTSIKKGKVPQFVDIQGIASSQFAIESMTGGKPYMASHPEMGVPMGLFNTKDEPNRASRIKAIQKYGTQGSISGVFPQYAEEFDPTKRVEGDAASAGEFLIKKAIANSLKPYMKYLLEAIEIGGKFADQLEGFAGEADENIRSAIQGAGVIGASNWGDLFDADNTPLSRAAFFQQSILKAANELNTDEGIFTNLEMLGNLQKAYTDYSKTNVLLGKEDLKSMVYLQTTFDLAANDVGEIKGAFMEIGMSSKDMMEYSNDLAKDARKYGISASKLFKDTAKLMKMGMAYRFKGGVKDMEKMQVYAAGAHFDIEKAYSVMDKSMSIEGAMDIATQIQLLGGEFANVNTMDLFAAAQTGDMKKFKDLLIEPIRREAAKGRFGEMKDGQFFSSGIGRQLMKTFEGMGNFDLGTDIKGLVTQSAKEEDIRKQILSGINKNSFLQYSKDEQQQILTNLAQGSVKGMDLTKANFAKTQIDFANVVLQKAQDSVEIGPETAKAAMSTEDQEKINKQIVALQSQTTVVFDELKKGLQALKPQLLVAGNTIMNVGLNQFKHEEYRIMRVMQDYLGFSAEESVLFYDVMKDTTLANQKMGSLIISVLDVINNPEKLATGLFSSNSSAAQDQISVSQKIEAKSGGPTPMSTTMYVAATNPVGTFNEKGGILQAAGGMVMGPSHANGGVRGSGKFNNVEVEGGEAIINKKSTQMFLPLLSKLNEIGGGQSFSSSNSMNLFSAGNGDKIISLNVNGNLNYNSKDSTKSKLNQTSFMENSRELIEMVQKIEAIKRGKVFGGAY